MSTFDLSVIPNYWDVLVDPRGDHREEINLYYERGQQNGDPDCLIALTPPMVGKKEGKWHLEIQDKYAIDPIDNQPMSTIRSVAVEESFESLDGAHERLKECVEIFPRPQDPSKLRIDRLNALNHPQT